MRSPKELRDRATRYLAMALIAHEREDVDLAEALAERATRLMEQADAGDRGQVIPGQPEATPATPNAQQQQQAQPKDGNEQAPKE